MARWPSPGRRYGGTDHLPARAGALPRAAGDGLTVYGLSAALACIDVTGQLEDACTHMRRHVADVEALLREPCTATWLDACRRQNLKASEHHFSVEELSRPVQRLFGTTQCRCGVWPAWADTTSGGSERKMLCCVQRTIAMSSCHFAAEPKPSPCATVCWCTPRAGGLCIGRRTTETTQRIHWVTALTGFRWGSKYRRKRLLHGKH